MKGEIEFSKTAEWTWLPVRDYFEAFRRNQDIIGMLNEHEVELLTATMHILKERMGYIYRKSADFSSDLGPPIGRNIKLEYGNDQSRADLQSDLQPIVEAAKAARKAVAKNMKVPAPNLTRPAKIAA